MKDKTTRGAFRGALRTFLFPITLVCVLVPIAKAYGYSIQFYNTQAQAQNACVATEATIPNPPYCNFSCDAFAGAPGYTNNASPGYTLYQNCVDGSSYIGGIFQYPASACQAGQTFAAPGVCNPALVNPKDLGSPKCGTSVFNPCSAANGNKYEREEDYASPDGTLDYVRHYNSLGARASGAGYNWWLDISTRLFVNGNIVQMLSGNGRLENFTCAGPGSTCTGGSDTVVRITEDTSGYTVTYRDGTSSRHDTNGVIQYAVDRSGRRQSYGHNSSGYLTSVTGAYGHRIALNWNFSASTVTSITTPAGQLIRYSYAAQSLGNNLVRVDYPDGTAKIYHYEDSRFPEHLTGISYVEANGATNRYSTYSYDSNSKAQSTEHTDGPKFTLSYDSSTQTTVADAANTSEVMTFASNLGTKNLLSKINQMDSKGLTQTFDARNNVTCRRDDEGRVTTYMYNSTNQKTSMTEGLAGDCANPVSTNATRTTTYQYKSTTLDLPTVISSPSVASGQTKTITLAYGDTAHPNLPTTITQSGFTPTGIAVSRGVTLTYNASGRVSSIDGPRTDVSDVTTLAYYNCTTGGACGQLQRITNTLGQVTTYDAYDANGRVTQVTDSNGLRTNYGYDARGRVTSIVQTPASGGSRTTTYTYNAAGNVTSVTFPDGVALTYTYNAAQLLTKVTDNLGNHVDYSYDLKGNRTGESVYDASGTLVRQVATAYDIRNRVASINAGGSLTQTLYDAIGNLVSETDPKNNPATTHGYDALNRLTQTIDALNGTTAFSYNASDRLTQVTAPNSATTQYVYDDLGNLLQEISPDRGTITYTYDAAGNVLTKTDARGIAASYAYDALNRIVAIDYPGTNEDVTFSYDSGTLCTTGVGRLCQVTDASGTTQYGYDAFGNVLTEQKTELGIAYTTSYTYDPGNRVSSIIYPNGRTVSYTRDALGRVTDAAATVNGTNQNLVSGRAYRPDGLFLAQTYGNGLSETRTYDTKGLLTNQSLASADTRVYGYDANSNLTSLQSLPQVGAHTYDALDRLIQDEITSTPASTRSFTYDANGNRLTDGTNSYSYATASNRLSEVGSSTVTLDAAGNTLSDGTYTYSYNNDGRLSQVSQGSTLLASYTYNYLGQRTRKVAEGATTLYHYATSANLIAETRADGTLIRDYAWIDATPIAQIDSGTSATVTYLHADHLGTPRVGTAQNQAIVWRWESGAFGDGTATQDPDGDGIPTIINLRMAGQYFDFESGLFYNWNRYYDPRTGRYITSDPIGLRGGLNTYVYANANPLRFIDSNGLASYPERVLATLRGEAVGVYTGLALFATFGTALEGSNIDVSRFGETLYNDPDLALAFQGGFDIGIWVPAVAGTAAASCRSGAANGLPNSAVVCRGGTCTADKFANGRGVTVGPDGKLNGVSVNSAPNKTVEQLTSTIPNRQVGVTTVGDIRRAGGDVLPSPSSVNPNHCTLCGITPQQAERLFTPTVRNPNVR